MAICVLVIEDDTDVRRALRMLLEDEDYTVVEAEDGETGLTRFSAHCVDLALVDLKLPGRSGFEVCRAIRALSDVPIVIVTAQVDSYDTVAGLEAGADDYVTKPFVPKVLTARIRALLRRSQGSGGGIESSRLRFGEVEIGPKEGIVTKAGHQVLLTKTEFRLLCDLAQHAGQVMSRDVLLERVWGYDYAGDGRLVDCHISRLRTKLADGDNGSTLIATVRGLGYRLDPA